MKITIAMLHEKAACSEGMEWVNANLPEGAEYREFIEKLEASGHAEWADWLIGQFEVLVLAEKWRIDSLLKSADGAKGELCSSGGSAKIGSSGYSAQIGSSGNYAQIGSSGNYAQIGSSGDYAKIGSSGYYAKIGSSGYSAQIGSSGYYAKIEASGKKSIIASVGYESRAKAGEDGCIALAWWDEKAKRPRLTVGYVGEGLKADTWYEVCNGELTEKI
jgi:hypothetical protein